MSQTPGKSLKSRNMPWLSALVTLDAALIATVVWHNSIEYKSLTNLASLRLLMSVFVPVIVLFVVELLPSEVKASLVYWRFRDVLPGHRSFSIHAKRDCRIDFDALTKNVGAPPTDPKEQNAFWYKLYKKVGSEITVSESHRMFLLYRDMATISVMLAVLSPIALLALDTPLRQSMTICGMLLFQYLITALSARNTGIRFVTNVLSIHSTKKVR